MNAALDFDEGADLAPSVLTLLDGPGFPLGEEAGTAALEDLQVSFLADELPLYIAHH